MRWRKSARLASELNQRFRMRVRQRIEKNRFDGRKYHRRGPDAQRDRNQSRGGKPWRAGEQAQRNATVSQHADSGALVCQTLLFDDLAVAAAHFAPAAVQVGA
jgi:hypothetical protein